MDKKEFIERYVIQFLAAKDAESRWHRPGDFSHIEEAHRYARFAYRSHVEYVRTKDGNPSLEKEADSDWLKHQETVNYLNSRKNNSFFESKFFLVVCVIFPFFLVWILPRIFAWVDSYGGMVK